MPSEATEPPHPPDPGLGSSSSDELAASLSSLSPDPMLGDYTSGEISLPASRSQAFDADVVAAPGPRPQSPSQPESYDAVTGKGERTIAVNAFEPPPRLSSADAIPSIDLTGPVPPKPKREPKSDDDDDEPSPPRSLGTILLMSYASAVTIGLIWVMWSNRRPKENVEPEPPAIVDSVPDDDASVSSSRNTQRTPIPTESIAKLGETVQIGLIEATPLDLTYGPVWLVRNFEPRNSKRGGKALRLRLRLRNTSSDVVLAPMDETFVRERPGADPDTVIETGDRDEPFVGSYPLALDSEWSIVGQNFRELKPGESFETVVVSAPDTKFEPTARPIWRIRLRTDADHTDDFGVRFVPSNIKTR